MLANSWASAGGTPTSRRTRSVADALSAARSSSTVTRPGTAVPGTAVREAEGDAEGHPGGSTSLAWSRPRCCWCWASSPRTWLAGRSETCIAAWYSAIMACSAAMTACSVITSGDSAGRPASGSGPAKASEDRQPAVASSAGSAAAEAASTRRLGRMSGTRASYRIWINVHHGASARPIRVTAPLRIG
jgi:hypothetical protein